MLLRRRQETVAVYAATDGQVVPEQLPHGDRSVLV